MSIEWAPWCGPRITEPSSTPWKTRSRNASFSSIGTSSAHHGPATSLVYEEKDERFNIGAGRTRDDLYIVLECASHTTTEEQILPADDPTGEWKLIEPRRDEIEYYADHRNGQLYIRVNDAGRNFRMVTTPLETPGHEHWKELIPHRPEAMLEEVDLFADHAVTWERIAGLQRVKVVAFPRRRSGVRCQPRNCFSRARLQHASACESCLRHEEIQVRLPVSGDARLRF